jgi:hypothetical protein
MTGSQPRSPCAAGRVIATAVVASVVLLVSGAGSPASGSSTRAGDSVCGYLFEWLHVVRFPVQPDPHAAYSYVALNSEASAQSQVAFLVRGPFPYAAWTSWDVYGAQAKPVAVANDNAIAADRGSVNPFVVGARVLSRRRNFTLLYLPYGIAQSDTAPSLRRVAAANVFAPNVGSSFVLANRVYQAFPGYNQGGSGGPTKTPFPVVRAVDYRTGEPVSCARFNLLPSALQRSPARPPRAGSTRLPPRRIRLTNGALLPRADAPTSGMRGAEFAPPNPPGIVRFTRPPLAAGADVSAIPPPDNCAGYLGTRTSLTRISLIRMPHVPTFFDVTAVTPTTKFVQNQATYVSFTEYGASLGVYAPGRPITTSLGDDELKVDATGGSTVVVWPRRLSRRQRHLVFTYAERRGWAILRGGTRNQYTTANLLIREKGSSGYQFGVGRVPCYYGTPADPMHTGQPWRHVVGDEYNASPSNIGPGAPQGVTCAVEQFTDGNCLRRLKAHIRSSRGRYFAP